ncbi:MAG TPA: dTDP-4-dehydrorhamnose 3,5-epimerase [bacterium]|nr:dTDP-4-dehydrorhamnose 3,5-epimerase [bacterium]
MRITPVEIPGILVIEPDVFRDSRGLFLETYHQAKYFQSGIREPFVQDNRSRSLKNVIRGLHAQRQQTQGKLIHVIEGEIYDVAVDVRRGLPTFGKWFGIKLSQDNFKQVFIPPGFVHGFAVLSDFAQVEYKCTDFYRPEEEITIRWNDPDIGIDWQIKNPILSDKDRNAPLLNEVMDILPIVKA